MQWTACDHYGKYFHAACDEIRIAHTPSDMISLQHVSIFDFCSVIKGRNHVFDISISPLLLQISWYMFTLLCIMSIRVLRQRKWQVILSLWDATAIGLQVITSSPCIKKSFALTRMNPVDGGTNEITEKKNAICGQPNSNLEHGSAITPPLNYENMLAYVYIYFLLHVLVLFSRLVMQWKCYAQCLLPHL